MPADPHSAPEIAFEGLVSALGARRLVIVSGKGGVGRTTLAALLGAELAAKGRRVLVATTGHDDRLAWMLGADRLGDQPREVAPSLWIQRLVPATCVEEYGVLVTGRARLSHVVFGNKAVRRLMRAIPGLDDFAILGKAWHVACRARDFDTVIFDGPASGHLRLVLGVPKAIVGAVAEGPLTREAQAMVSALTDPGQTAAVLVGLPEAWPLTELDELAAALRDELGMTIGALVVNQMRPSLSGRADWGNWGDSLQAPGDRLRALGDEGGQSPALREMMTVVADSEVTARGQRETVERWLAAHPEARDAKVPALLQIPWWPWGIDGPERVRELLEALRTGEETRREP